MRRLNTSVVLRALAEHDEPVTMATLVGQVRLSRRTVELILTQLCESGWAVEVRPVHLDVGRPPRYFSFEADRALVVAVRIDTHAASAAVSDIRGRVLGRGLVTLRNYSDTDQTMIDAEEAVDGAIRESGQPRDRVRAGAVASGGAIDEDGVVHRLIHAPAWNEFALADVLGDLGIPIILAGFLIAAILRVAQGSATVALTTAAGLISPAILAGDFNAFQVAALVVAVAGGSVVASHVNDSGFWLVGRFFEMDVKTTLKTWTVMETAIGVMGFAIAAAVFGVASLA
jgi:hypothetical protein